MFGQKDRVVCILYGAYQMGKKDFGMSGWMKWMNRAIALALCTIPAFLLCGCAGAELENKSFPLAVLIDGKKQQCRVCYLSQQLSEVANERSDGGNVTAASASGSTYYETQKAFEKNNRCQLDMSHTKALIFKESYMEDGQLELFLETVRRENTYARNTLVYFTDSSMESLAGLNDELEVPLGSYLEQMMENEQDIKEQAVVTLGILLNEQANSNRTVLVPVLKEENGLPVIHAYDILQDFEYKGRADVEEAQVYYLLRNQLNQLDLQLDAGVQVRLNGLHCEREFFSGRAKSHGGVTEALTLTADMEQITGGALDAQVEEALYRKIQGICQDNLAQKQADLSDSYRYLAMHAPDVYRQYKGQAAKYRENLAYQVNVRIANPGKKR